VALLAIIPVPQELSLRTGAFHLGPGALVALSNPEDQELQTLGRFAAEMLGAALGGAIAVADTPAHRGTTGAVILILGAPGPSLGPEGYRLESDPAAVRITAATHAGLFYGLQTLSQLVSTTEGADTISSVVIPAVAIQDRPRFTYRGMHLDVGRHFFPTSFIKRYIDLMAQYKMNTFHWHLTEDQGWRIEIRRYPRLTAIGSCRRETMVEKNFDPYVGDGIPHCGFYTQDEIREVVAYAASRYVTVIPEIEMPGHSMAALAAYPELACTGGPFQVATRWGVHEDVYCPSEETFAFLENVLAEVMDLFPSPYIHIGGDEAPKKRWEESTLAQEVIRREGLANELELQSYFIRRIERFLRSHGRRLIGWDEILEGGLPPEATVMSWRSMDGGIAAARQGHDVIMTPTSHVYFDYYQGDPAYEPLAIGGFTPLENVYAFDPIPAELTSEEARHVLGAQGNVWTEYLKTPDDVEYMALPRMLALAEVVWSPQERRDWAGFAARLPHHLRRLDAMEVHYRIPHIRGLDRDRLILGDSITVALTSLVPDAAIHYTTDGSDPTEAAPRYTGPLVLEVSGGSVTVAARAFLPNGRVSTAKAATFRKTSLRPPLAVDAAALAPGLRYQYYEAAVASVDSLRQHWPVREGISSSVALQGDERDERFGLTFQGLLHVPRDAVYDFRLTSDDGSRLLIAGEVVIDHDGLHGPTERSGMIALAAGYHTIAVRFFQAGGGKALDLRAHVERESAPVPLTEWLYHEQ
jgi:hexosaminidase